MKRHLFKSMRCTCLLLMAAIFAAPVSANTETISSILIVPFDIHAQKDQSFIRPAITDMLYTRLSAENRTVMVEKMSTRTEPVSAEDALSMGQALDVDYVLFGSITILGTMISTDAQFVDIAQAKPVLTFNEVGQDQGDIITHMDHLTTQINESIFNVPKAIETPPKTDQGSDDDIHTHPEKLVIPGLQPKTPPLPAPSGPGIVIAPQPGKDAVSLSYWKSEKFTETIQGISLADIDGNGSKETVFIGRKQVYVYRYQDDLFQEISTFGQGSFNRLIHVDTADINRNGKAEIFVTDYSASQKRLKSMVLEWNGRDFDIIAQRVDWYLRILETPRSGALLLGQKRGRESGYTASVKEALFDRDVYEMKWQDGQYVPTGLYALPGGLSLYDFSRGDVSNNGQIEIVAFSPKNYIVVYDQNGELAWEGDESYGGNRLFLETPDPNDVRRTANYYLPQRIHVTDIDRDGLNEIIVLKNHDSAAAMSRIKAFNKGHIDCLSFDDIGIQRKWQTRSIAGYISDYIIGDLNNDGIDEIVFSVIEKEKSLFNKGKSYIVTCIPGN